ncbi:MAG TPA: hypothetical protein VLB29_17860 [Nocardioidaceae bacterium]|nr:hypothetical protein [Nocardioidaceae bacterium]
MYASLNYPHLHERWFVEQTPGNDWSFFFSPLPLVLTTVMVALALAWRRLALRMPTPELAFLRPLGRLAPWVPRILGVHLGVTLLALAATGSFLTPAVVLEGVLGSSLLLAEAALGVWLVSGFQIRPAAALTLTLGPALAVFAGPVALLECANIAAVAGFLVVLPPGDDAHGRVAADPVRLRAALLALRLGVGVALVSLAFSEKFTNPEMATHTLQDFPALDVLAWVGIDLAPTTFVAVAGAVELLFGLLVISGAMPQVAVLVAMVPFNATLALFGQTELVGHLPVYGFFLAMLVYASDESTAPLVRWIPSMRWIRAARLAARVGA